MAVETRDVAPGLWLWRQPHPEWQPGLGWEPPVSSFSVTSNGVTVLVDALAPPDGDRTWERLDAAPPAALVVLKPDHVRSADELHGRYGTPVYGPAAIRRELGDDTPFVAVEPGNQLPGGLRALDDGRGRGERPLYLAAHRALVFADGVLADPDGRLRVWATPQHEEIVLPTLRALLELPVELVLVSHGEPVHDRAEFEAALERPPWAG